MDAISNKNLTKTKILLFGFIDMNSMDGSAVFLSSLANTLSLDPNVEVDFLLARPIVRDILISPLERIDNINIINPFEDPYYKEQNFEWVRKGFIDYDIAEQIIKHYWDNNDYDWLFVRSVETVQKLLKHDHIISKTMVYITGLAHSTQDVADDSIAVLREMYEKSAQFFCQTYEMKERILELLNLNQGENKVEVMLPMVPDVNPNLIPKVKKKVTRLVYTGKFDPKWRSMEIVTAFKELRREYPDLELEIAGDKFNRDPNYPEFKEELTYLLNNTEGLTWYGAVSREMSRTLIRNSDIGITWRSEEMDTSLELSTKLLEYGTFRKAVILNPTEMHLKLFGEDYPLYAVTEQDFRNVIKKAIEDPEVCEFAANRMFEVCSQFTFSKSIQRLQPIIWRGKLIEYVETVQEKVFKIGADFLPELEQKTLQNLPSKISTITDQSICIITNVNDKLEKLMLLNKLSLYGKITKVDKLGNYDFIYITKDQDAIEVNIENNIKFYEIIGNDIVQREQIVEVIDEQLPQADNKTLDRQLRLLKRELDKTKKQLYNTKKKYDTLTRKYNALSNSKLGKLAIKYWNFRKKLGRK